MVEAEGVQARLSCSVVKCPFRVALRCLPREASSARRFGLVPDLRTTATLWCGCDLKTAQHGEQHPKGMVSITLVDPWYGRHGKHMTTRTKPQWACCKNWRTRGTSVQMRYMRKETTVLMHHSELGGTRCHSGTEEDAAQLHSKHTIAAHTNWFCALLG